MRLSPDQIDALAAEYVVGGLTGAARRRFETVLAERADARLAVHRWERMLMPIALGVTPVTPPASLWTRIARALPATDRRRERRVWPWLTALVPIAAAAVVWIYATAPQPTIVQQAVFADTGANALWLISLDTERERITIDTRGTDPLPADQVYELWALPAAGSPVSLGLLQTDSGSQFTVATPARLAALDTSTNLAISIEPSGGSPTGAPTGPVVYQAAWVTL
ncbi:MAG: anti-sigma factor [Pseudomonadota bacterium]